MRRLATALTLASLLLLSTASSVGGIHSAAGQGQYHRAHGDAYECAPAVSITVEPVGANRADITIRLTPSARHVTLLQCVLIESTFVWKNVPGNAAQGWSAKRDVPCNHEELRIEPAGPLSGLQMVRTSKCTFPRHTETWSAVLAWSP